MRSAAAAPMTTQNCRSTMASQPRTPGGAGIFLGTEDRNAAGMLVNLGGAT